MADGDKKFIIHESVRGSFRKTFPQPLEDTLSLQDLIELRTILEWRARDFKGNERVAGKANLLIAKLEKAIKIFKEGI